MCALSVLAHQDASPCRLIAGKVDSWKLIVGTPIEGTKIGNIHIAAVGAALVRASESTKMQTCEHTRTGSYEHTNMQTYDYANLGTTCEHADIVESVNNVSIVKD